jgi:hypothetical protein
MLNALTIRIGCHFSRRVASVVAPRTSSAPSGDSFEALCGHDVDRFVGVDNEIDGSGETLSKLGLDGMVARPCEIIVITTSAHTLDLAGVTDIKMDEPHHGRCRYSSERAIDARVPDTIDHTVGAW